MKPVLTKSWLALTLALCAAPFAQAQNCGTGGGATVCLSASGTGSDVRLSWTASGDLSGLQVYRDTDTDPNGRSRIAMLGKNADPFDFTLDANSTSWKWGQAANPSGWANEAYTDAQFQKMKTGFIDKGVPVLLGEYGAIVRTEYDPAGTYRKNWDQYITRAAFTRGVVPMYWDNGYTANHQFGLFNRATGAQAFPDVISTIVNAAK